MELLRFTDNDSGRPILVAADAFCAAHTNENGISVIETVNGAEWVFEVSESMQEISRILEEADV